jgi:hypothetical protein
MSNGQQFAAKTTLKDQQTLVSLLLFAGKHKQSRLGYRLNYALLRKSLRNTLPTLLLGSSSINSMILGRL